MAAASDKDKKQVMDVAKPGSTAADATARPVIVGHGGMLKDPMVTPAAETESDASLDTPEKPVEEKPVTTSHKIIAPLAKEKPAEPEEAKSEEPESQDDQSKDDDDDQSGSEEGIIDAVVDQAAASKRKENQLSDEEKKKQEAIDQLIENKTYAVPIGQAAKRHRRYALLAVLAVLLLIAGGAAYAFSTGLIKIDSVMPAKKETPAEPVATPVKPTPKPTHSTYKSTTDTLTLQYPVSWAIDKNPLNNSLEYAIFNPIKPASQQLTTKVELNRLPATAGYSSYPTQIIEQIDYTPFKSGKTDLYVQQTIYSEVSKGSQAARYSVRFDVVDTKDQLKVGGHPRDIYFHAVDGKTRLVLRTVLTLVDTDGKLNFSSRANLDNYIKGNAELTEAKALLASVRL